MSTSGIQKAAVFCDDVGSPSFGTVVQLNHVNTEGDFHVNGLGTETAAGIQIYAGAEALAQIGFADVTALTQLEVWQEDQTPLKLVLAGLQESGLWYEPVA